MKKIMKFLREYGLALVACMLSFLVGQAIWSAQHGNAPWILLFKNWIA